MATELSLDTLAKQINEAYGEIQATFGHSLEHAIHAGELLEKAKARLPHGEWLPWVEKNVKFTDRTARTYMNVAMNKEILLANRKKISDLTLDGAIHLLKSGTPILQSMSNEWWTPAEYIQAVREVMGEIDLDPASTPEANKIVGAKRIFTEDDDGLSQDWTGRVFLNPPWGKLCREFVARLYEFLGSGVDEAVVLVNSNSADTDWFQPLFNGVMCFTDHRIDFNSPEEKATSSTHGSCFIYFGPHDKQFAAAFEKFGNVVRRWP